MTHICISKLNIIGSDNGLTHGWCQAIIWTNAGILLIGYSGTKFSEILIAIQTFSFKKMHLKLLSGKLLLLTKPQWVLLPAVKMHLWRGFILLLQLKYEHLDIITNILQTTFQMLFCLKKTCVFLSKFASFLFDWQKDSLNSGLELDR